MISVNNLRQGAVFKKDNSLYQVVLFSHIKMGRGGAIIKTKVKNLESGSLSEKSFKNSDSVEEAILEKKSAQYLYSDQNDSFFMDSQTFEQYQIPNQTVGSTKKFLKEGMVVDILCSSGKVLNLEMPIKAGYLVTEAPPNIRGNTVSGGSKLVIIETGAQVSVPLFIKTGDKIKINTQEGVYVERI